MQYLGFERSRNQVGFRSTDSSNGGREELVAQ